MRPTLLFSAVVLLVTLLAPAQARGQATVADPVYRPGAVLVGFKAQVDKSARTAAIAAEGLAVTGEIQELGVVSVAAPVGDEAATARRLALRPEVAFAELDYQATAVNAIIPNDPDYGKQWGLAQIGASEAWEVTTGAANVVIAVVDSGIDLSHPDLISKLWKNTGEIAGNRIDDDGNGKVDDIYGWHFYHALSGSTYIPQEDGRVSDDNGHGTHVAGIAGAATNNARGVAGVSWSSRLMTVKVLDKFGNAWFSEVAEGILYAADNGAAIINMSLGGPATPEGSQTLCIAASQAAGKGKLLVAAVGNEADRVFYPAACPGVLAVAATDRSDQGAAFSNAGSRVDLAAPGVDIWSTSYAAGLDLSTYMSRSGTSQATPHVAGAAALVWARWPALSAEGVKAQLIGSVVDVGLPGRDDKTGWGRLDLAAAVHAPVSPVDLRVSAEVAPQVVVAGNPLTATFTVTNSSPTQATSLTMHVTLATEAMLSGVHSAGMSCTLDALALTCGAKSLPAGQSLSATVVMTPTIVGTGVLTTTVAVSAAQPDPVLPNNSRAVVTAIRPALSGRVFRDDNGDGVRQPWETRGVADAWLFLEQGGQPVDYRTTQAPDGAYRFETLAVGPYTLIAEAPVGFVLTTPAQIPLTIAPGEEQTVHFGAWTGAADPTPVPIIFLPLVMR